MELWSNPTPSNADSATLSSQYRVQAADIGHLVNAILDYRRQQEQQQQKAYSDIAKGVAGAYSGYQQGQAAGDANDAANAATYGALYPNDWQSAYTDPGRVPDYGGTSALAGIEAERKLNPDAFMSEYQRMLMESKINNEDARTLNSLNSMHGGNGYDNQLGPVTQTDDQGVTWRQGAGGHWYPLKEPRTPNDEPPADFPDAVTQSDIDAMGAYRQQSKGVRQSDINQAAQAPDLPPVAPDQPTTAPGNPPAATGIAPSRDEAAVGGYYRAPDGSVRIRQN